MTGKDGLCAVLHKTVQGAHVGGVGHADAHARFIALIEGTGSKPGVLIVAQVRIVHAREFQPQTVQFQRVVAVHQAGPAARFESLVHLLDGQGHTRALLNHLRGARLPQIACRVLENGGEIAIRAGHKHAGEIHERVERLQ